MQDDPFNQRKTISPINEELVLRELADTQPVPVAPTPPQSIAAPLGTEPVQPTAPPAGPPLIVEDNPLVPDVSNGRFPWVRTLLIGLLLPPIYALLVALTAVALAFFYLASVSGSSSLVGPWLGAIATVPYVVAFVVIIVASKMLKRMEVQAPFIVSLGTVLFALGTTRLLAALKLEFITFDFSYVMSPGEFSAPNMLGLLSIPLLGGVAMALLVVLTNKLSSRLSGAIILGLVVLMVAAPWAAYFALVGTQPAAEDTTLKQGQSLQDLKASGSEATASGSRGRMLFATTTYGPYNTGVLEKCIDNSMVIPDVQSCTMSCVQEAAGVCVTVAFTSGVLDGEQEAYVMKDGKCDAASLAFVLQSTAMNRHAIGGPDPDSKLPTPRLKECYRITTPKGTAVFGEAHGSASGVGSYYFSKGSAVVHLRLQTAGKLNGLSEEAVATTFKAAEADMLGFIDTFAPAAK